MSAKLILRKKLAAAIVSQPDAQTELLQQLVTRLDRLEAKLSEEGSRPSPSMGRDGGKGEVTGYPSGVGRRSRGPIICRKCGQEGHIAKGCASRGQAP